MKLTFEQILSAAHGAAHSKVEDGALRLCRLTPAQAEFYKDNKDNYDKSFATAGVHLDFTTSSRTLSLELEMCHADGVSWYSNDIYINGSHTMKIEGDLKDSPDMCHVCRRTLTLEDTRSRVQIYFPWTAATKIREITLDDGAEFIPTTHSLKMVHYGDSITHGSWAKDASHLYVVRICEALDAVGFNKGIGGDVMRPGFTKIPEDNGAPDIVTVAYGTNDWTGKTAEEFSADCKEFYTDLRELYPNAKIFALAPIWRGKCDTPRKAGEFSSIAKMIKEVADSLEGVVFIDCFDFVPAKPEMYCEDLLHPSDLGFEHYAKNLVAEMKKYL